MGRNREFPQGIDLCPHGQGAGVPDFQITRDIHHGLRSDGMAMPDRKNKGDYIPN